MTMPPLVSTKWLAGQLTSEKTRIIDASWRMPGAGDARDDYRKRHIPGAQFFDIDAIADQTTDLPHMTPSPEMVAAALGEMGVSNQSLVVVYDDAGIFSAPRVWWTLRAFGHAGVSVLDGGLKKWLAEGRAVSEKPTKIKPEYYKIPAEPTLIATANDVRDAMQSDIDIIDARNVERFSGESTEPRAGLRSGAMPGAKNVPFDALVKPDGIFRSAEEIRQVFVQAGVDLTRPAITTCGSGITAAVLALALERIGHHDWRLYDGSWAEWGMPRNDPHLFLVAGAD